MMRLRDETTPGSRRILKRWMRSIPQQLPDGRWIPEVQVWEETPSGSVEHARLMAPAGVAAPTEAEARILSAELARRWILHGPGGYVRCMKVDE
jgi:hypothetical protein